MECLIGHEIQNEIAKLVRNGKKPDFITINIFCVDVLFRLKFK